MPNIIAKSIVRKIENALIKSGIMYRVFYRTKSDASLNLKILKNPLKYNQKKKIQDLIGIRVILYFKDDICICQNILENIFDIDKQNSVIDEPRDNQFGVVRHNLIFNIDDANKESILEYGKRFGSVIDTTFEIQIRTVLSEGWHEVEHDLRYKVLDEWKELQDENRMLNGLYASLETSEWSLLKVFDDIAYKHYKSKTWEAMIRNKLRLRIEHATIPTPLRNTLNSNNDIAKKILRSDRSNLIKIINKLQVPISYVNIIYIINHIDIHDQEITHQTPQTLLKALNEIH